MASSKLQLRVLLLLLLELTYGASGGVHEAALALVTKRKPLGPSILRVSPSKLTIAHGYGSAHFKSVMPLF